MSGTTATFPEEFVAVDPVEIPLSSGRLVPVPAWRAEFAASPDRSSMGLDRAYAAKPLVMVEKQAMFPEIACLSLFKRTGWDGVWADGTHRKYFDKMPMQSKGTSLDTYVNQLVSRIADNNGKSKAGCWDLILWDHKTLVFVAVAPAAPDGPATPAVAEAGARWLAAALRTGLSANQFAVVRWAYRSVVVRRRRARGD
jgi:hypothetical protein